MARFESLPEDRFPNIRTDATELTSGAAHARFDFTVALMLGSLTLQ